MRSDKNATVGSPAAAFAFVSDFNSCYKIAFEKQGVRPIPVWWNEFDSIMGNHDITVRLHEKFKVSHDFIGSLTQLSDEYYDSIVAEENGDAE